MAYQKVFWRCGGRVQVDGPVHECLAASDGKDDGIHVVNGNGFDDHCLCSVTPVRFNMGFSFFAGGFGVYSLRVLCCKAYDGERGHKTVWGVKDKRLWQIVRSSQLQFGKLRWKFRVGV